MQGHDVVVKLNQARRAVSIGVAGSDQRGSSSHHLTARSFSLYMETMLEEGWVSCFLYPQCGEHLQPTPGVCYVCCSYDSVSGAGPPASQRASALTLPTAPSHRSTVPFAPHARVSAQG